MSSTVLVGFMPWTTSYLTSHESSKAVWDIVFPTEVTELCPVPTYTVPLGSGSFTISWPTVAIMMLLGIICGFTFGVHVLLASFRSSQRTSGSFMWGSAFISYAVMCLGAMFTHSILTDYSHVFYLMDVIGTGCAGTSAVGAFLCSLKLLDDRRPVWRIVAVSIFSILNYLAIVGTPFLRDQIYIVPTIGTVVLAEYKRRTIGKKALLKEPTTPDEATERAAENWLGLGTVGTLVALGSVPADRWLCYTLGSHGSLLFWAFLGCNLTLLAGYKYITCLQSVPARSLKSKDQ